MREPFDVLWSERATLDLLHARAWLGTARAALLDEAVGAVVAQLASHPYSGPPAWFRGGHSTTVRRIIVGESHLLWYRVFEEEKTVYLVCLRHQRQRPPRL
jgi:plasmid stabilization system protein ParE